MDKKTRAKEKLARIPIKINNTIPPLKKPKWLKTKLPSIEKIQEIDQLIKSKSLVTVCEEASCPNLPECYSRGTATFMILGNKCTRRCSFCDVAHGKPDPIDKSEPKNLADAIEKMNLKYAVITSVDRDDLLDGGSEHFLNCVNEIKKKQKDIKLELLVPDFRGRMEIALANLNDCNIQVLNHNIETIPRLYKQARPGSDYKWSLSLLAKYKKMRPDVLTKSGIMLGLGETDEEIYQTLKDLRENNVDIVTIGQYLSPSEYHLRVDRYVTPEQFNEFSKYALEIGFKNAVCGPLVRSSYHAEEHVNF